jgi:hypothetical protein
MALIPYTSHLTAANSELEKQRAKTHAGMAHFASTRPDNATCRECLSWCINQSKPYARTGELKPQPCAKFAALTGAAGPRVPPTAPACKYFEQNPDALPLLRRGRR